MGYRQTFGDAGLGSVSNIVSSLPAGYTLGERRREGAEEYVLIYNSGGASATIGNAMVGGVGGVGAYSASVTTPANSTPPLALGCVKHATVTTGSYAWLLTRGDAGKLVVSNVSIATGMKVQVGVDGVFASTVNSNVVGYNRGDSDGTGTTDTFSGDFQVQFS
jgi:hypothetical protein